MATGEDYVKKALKKAGVLAVGETPNYDMANDALETCNDMLELWNNDGKIVYEIVDETQTITASTGSYTIGDGATWDTDRPVKIVQLNVRDSNNYNYKLHQCSATEWAGITDKTLTSTRPDRFWYDKTYPNGVINLHPIPTSSLTAVIYSWKQFTAMTLAGTVNLPTGYKQAVVMNLAKELCIEYGQAISKDLQRSAWTALNLISSANNKGGTTHLDSGVAGRRHSYNVYTDE